MKLRLVHSRPLPEVEPTTNQLARANVTRHPTAIAAHSDNLDRYYGDAWAALMSHIDGHYHPIKPRKS